MAIMIPEKPKEIDPKSHEDIMFEELRNLPDTYYVFHSFSIVNVNNNTIRESEADFVIFNSKKGILCIEAKAGQVEYSDGCWRYGSGRKMSHDGPFIQAKNNKWKLKDYMEEHGLSYEIEHCKLLHAVWFPDVSIRKFTGMHLPAEANINIILTSESFGNIEASIEKIFSISVGDNKETKLSEKESRNILERVLAPSFHLISLHEAKLEHNRNVFKRMLNEQVALLNYLEEQNNAIINGLAGTGKTVIAVEKARRHSEKKEEVLFLCYNVFLKDYLKDHYPYPFVSYYTIDGLACKICETSTADYVLLKEHLETMFFEGSFPYKHVIIDEGQDFGREEIEEEDLIELLKVNAVGDDSRGGSFYLFYDKNQMVQSNRIPKYIEEADCKLTLYRNCRNTENIALTSLRLLGSDKTPKLLPGALLGDLPEILYAESKEETRSFVNALIDKYLESGYKDITILTCKTENNSILSEYANESKYTYKKGFVRFTTCRKFKGLESDAIIVVDIDKNTFGSEGEQLMYVGTSRARIKLACIFYMTEEDCIELMEQRNINYNKNVKKSLATALNAKYIKNIE